MPAATQITCAQLSGNPVDDLVAIDSLTVSCGVLTRTRLDSSSAGAFGEFDINQTTTREVSLRGESQPQAVLPMKLNSDV